MPAETPAWVVPAGRPDRWAAARGWQWQSDRAGDFSWVTLSRGTPGASRLTVYLEGDGAAWPSPFHPPADPTPRRAVALDLALRDASPAVVYLGRPCQYLSADERAACRPDYWLDRRFAPEVVAAYDRHLDRLRERFAVNSLRLVGYSGGGVLAALLAARRRDVQELVTIAAPLSLGGWTVALDLTPLTGSQDPAELPPATVWPAMQHFAGARDAVVPAAVVEAFAARHGGPVRVWPGVDHDCCWGPVWATWLRERGEVR